ncbi:MAG: hypothetical protein FWC92_00480 [Defluviitaleaceae bacterium]|nr:hypothetical protein [Defluviitaleaceae bacterium]
MTLKFIFVVLCLVVALVSYFTCRSKKDWLWLVLALAATVGADYFLVLHNIHLMGVAVFCFAHMAYIMRAVYDTDTSDRCRLWRCLPLAVVPVVGLAFVLANIYLVAGVYAALFITNIYVSARYVRHNRVLVIAGLLLFAACDLCVFLFNLPFYMGAPSWLTSIFPLIWVFYLPSQALLAVSAVDYTSLHSRS